MMTVEIVKRMKVKKIDLDKADVVNQEVCFGDEVMHVGMLCARDKFVSNKNTTDCSFAVSVVYGRRRKRRELR